MDKDLFQKEVYNVVAAIPPGRVLTYGQIAYLWENLNIPVW